MLKKDFRKAKTVAFINVSPAFRFNLLPLNPRRGGDLVKVFTLQSGLNTHFIAKYSQPLIQKITNGNPEN